MKSQRQPPSRAATQAETRERLLDAAQEAFSHRRVTDVSVDYIASQAGYSKGAVYANFETKIDLLFAVVQRRMIERGADYVELVHHVGNDDLGEAAGSRAGKTHESDLEYFRLVAALWGEAVHDPRLAERYAALRSDHRARLADAIEQRANEAGVELPVEAEQLAAGLIAMSMATMLDALIDPTIDPAAIHQTFAELVLAGVLARASTAQ